MTRSAIIGLAALAAVVAFVLAPSATPPPRPAPKPGPRPNPSPGPSPSVGPRLSIAELRDLAVRTGFPDPDVAAAVAMAESGGNPRIVGDLQYGGSYGLWQINAPAHRNYDTTLLLDPDYNARAAFAISSGGKNWNPWTTFRTGAYRAFLPRVVS